MERLFKFWESLTWNYILLGVLILLISFAVSFFVIGIVLVKIPQNYFHSEYEHHFMTDKHPVLRWTMLFVKNIGGVILILLGLLMTLPGVPGPGILTILIGLIMIDIPGKRHFEAMIIKRPTILKAANKLRARYSKPSLLID